MRVSELSPNQQQARSGKWRDGVGVSFSTSVTKPDRSNGSDK